MYVTKLSHNLLYAEERVVYAGLECRGRPLAGMIVSGLQHPAKHR